RPVRRERLLLPNPSDRMVGQVGVEVVLRVVRGLDRFGAVEQGRMPLIGIAADESVEVLEAESSGPEIERPRLARLPVGYVVVLAVPGRVPTVLLEDFRNRAAALWHHRIVAGVAGSKLRDDTRGAGVMVPSRNQRRA